MGKATAKQTAKQIVNALGRERVRSEVSVTIYAVRHVLKDGALFPPRWFKGVRRLCLLDGIELDEDLFNWSVPESERAKQ